MSKKKLFLSIAAIVLAVLMIVGCSAPAAEGTQEEAAATTTEAAATEETVTEETAAEETTGEGDPVKIGIWEPITGALAGGGAQKIEGYELAHDLRPTVLGRPVEFVYGDNKSDKVEAVNSITRLIEKEHVCSILGCYGSSLALAGIDVAEQAHIPTIPCASNPLVIQGRKYVARSNFEDPFGGTVMAVYAANYANCKTAVIFENIAEDYAVALTNFFTEAFEERGGKVVQVLNYTSGDQDFTAQLNTLKASGADCVFIPGYYTEAALCCIQMKEMGIDCVVLGCDGWVSPELLSIGGDAVEGAYLYGHFAAEQADENPLVGEFIDAFQAKYNKVPTSDSATAFVNYNLLLDSIEAAGDENDADAIMAWWRSLKDYNTVTGKITVDPETGSPTKTAVVLQIRNGEYVYVCSVNPND